MWIFHFLRKREWRDFWGATDGLTFSGLRLRSGLSIPGASALRLVLTKCALKVGSVAGLAAVVLFVLAFAGSVHASIWFEIVFTGNNMYIVNDNDIHDLDPAIGKIRLGEPDGSPLVIGGHRITAEARMWQHDGVRYVTMTNGTLTGMGMNYFSIAAHGEKNLPRPMVGYESRSYSVSLQRPWAEGQYAWVNGEGGLLHNDIDINFFPDVYGPLYGDPTTMDGKSLVFNPPDEEFRVFHTPQWVMWPEVTFSDLPTDIWQGFNFSGEVRMRFAHWIPEPSSGVIWSAFVLAGLARRRHVTPK